MILIKYKNDNKRLNKKQIIKSIKNAWHYEWYYEWKMNDMTWWMILFLWIFLSV